MDGTLLVDEEEDLIRNLNGRLTVNERTNASLQRVQEDDDEGEYETDTDDMGKLDEDLWDLFNDKLEGVEPRGKLKVLKECDWESAYQKISYWPSAHPATVPGWWVRGLLSVRWDLVVGLSGAFGRHF